MEPSTPKPKSKKISIYWYLAVLSGIFLVISIVEHIRWMIFVSSILLGIFIYKSARTQFTKHQNMHQTMPNCLDQKEKKDIKHFIAEEQPKKEEEKDEGKGKQLKGQKGEYKQEYKGEQKKQQIEIQEKEQIRESKKEKNQKVGPNITIQSNRGLTNLGNTCYMNSAIQCLHKTFQLTHAIKENNKPSIFIQAYLQLMDQLSIQNKTPYKPSKIKELVSKYYPIFEGYSQQDSGQLLSTLLNYINDELNEVTTKNYYNVNNKIKRSDEQLLQQYIKKDHSRSKSIIDDLIYGRFLTSYKCLKCENQQKLFQKFNILYLPVIKKKTQCLIDCMIQFCKPDKLQGDDAWWCSVCQKDMETDKTMSVYQANRILIICLKRFTQTRKINSVITFQHQINLKHITKNPKIENMTYDLYGVINHSGDSLHYGHYYSYCKVGNIWKEYNDRHVSQMSEKSIVSDDAFILLYRLRE